MKKKGSKTVVEGIEISHPEKVLYPDMGLTKEDLAEYYQGVAKWMLPYVANRPLSLVRCPGGHNAQCFFQKHPGTSLPTGLDRITIRGKKNKGEYLVVQDSDDLVQLAQMNVLEIHCWGCTADSTDKPDQIVFDLDPDKGVSSKQIVQAAKLLREVLGGINLESFVRTSGGKGLHVVVPLTPKATWKEAKEFSATVAKTFEEDNPKLYIATMSKAKRKGKIFIDYLRNQQGATSIANYSPRARENAPVATPLAWSELKENMSFNSFTIKNIFRRLKSGFKDPWAEFSRMKQNI